MWNHKQGLLKRKATQSVRARLTFVPLVTTSVPLFLYARENNVSRKFGKKLSSASNKQRVYPHFLGSGQVAIAQ